MVLPACGLLASGPFAQVCSVVKSLVPHLALLNSEFLLPFLGTASNSQPFAFL